MLTLFTKVMNVMIKILSIKSYYFKNGYLYCKSKFCWRGKIVEQMETEAVLMYIQVVYYGSGFFWVKFHHL